MSQNASVNKKKKGMVITSLSLVVVALILLCLWLFIWRFEDYTDDAYVHGNIVTLTPQVAGIVSSVNVQNTEYVREGQVLIELDETDLRLTLKKSASALAENVRKVLQMFETVDELQEDVKRKEALLIRAEQDYANRVNLVTSGAVSKEDFEHVTATLNAAKASLGSTQFKLQGALALVQGTTVATHPLVEMAKEKVKTDWVNFKRAKIVSPVNGYIAQRSVQLGEFVQQSKPLLAVIPLDEIWVNANFKEVHLSKMRVGQSVSIKSDMYGSDVIYRGKVVGIEPGTGSVFSALPPQNATGNWIKIVQRIPVRISLDQEQVQKYPLVLGMSMNVTVDIRDLDGERLRLAEPVRPIYQTDVYAQQIQGAERLIEAIIRDNS